MANTKAMVTMAADIDDDVADDDHADADRILYFLELNISRY